MVRGQWILGGFCGFSSKNKEGSFIAKREWGGGGIKGGDFGKLTSNDKGSSVYCRIPWHNQNSPISPPTIHYLLPCSEMSEDFGGIPWFSGGEQWGSSSQRRSMKGGDFRKLTSNERGSSEYCRTLWDNQNSLTTPPAPPQAVNNNDQSLIKYFTALSSTLLSTVQKKIIIN